MVSERWVCVSERVWSLKGGIYFLRGCRSLKGRVLFTEGVVSERLGSCVHRGCGL